MNWFDLVVGILLIVALLKGYRKGFVYQLVGLAIVVLSAIFGGKLADYILPEVHKLLDISANNARVLSFVLAFALIAVVISLIGRMIQKFIDFAFLSFFNRLLGGLIAVGTMMFVLSIILNLVLMIDKRDVIIKKNIKEESFLFERVEAVVPAVVPYLDKEFLEEYVPKNYRQNIENKSDSIYKVNPGTIDSSYQQQHFKIE
ncbi:MAG: CvpA family protein [Fermentimonas sp.]|jgi:membrane protein required for colicin V production